MMLLDDVLERSAIMEFDGGMSREYADAIAFREVMGCDMPYPVNTILFCASCVSDDAIAAAQEYISKKGLTAREVKLVKKDGMVLVVSKTVVFE